MPPVSQAQRGAMYAAAEGRSTISIPKKIGKEFTATDKRGKLPARKKASAGRSRWGLSTVQVDIYALCDPDTGDVRYIGKANCAQLRLKSHLRDARIRKTPVYCWINELLAKGLCPSGGCYALLRSSASPGLSVQEVAWTGSSSGLCV